MNACLGCGERPRPKAMHGPHPLGWLHAARPAGRGPTGAAAKAEGRRVQPEPWQRAARFFSSFPESHAPGKGSLSSPASHSFTRFPGKRPGGGPLMSPASAWERSIFAEDQRGVKLR